MENKDCVLVYSLAIEMLNSSINNNSAKTVK